MRANENYPDTRLRAISDSVDALGCNGRRPSDGLILTAGEPCGYPASAGISTFFAKTGYNSRCFGAIEGVKLKARVYLDACLRHPLYNGVVPSRVVLPDQFRPLDPLRKVPFSQPTTPPSACKTAFSSPFRGQQFRKKQWCLVDSI